jgi:hypothetical protein
MMIKKFPVEDEVLNSVRDELTMELHQLFANQSYITSIMPSPFDSEIRIFLQNEFNVLNKKSNKINDVLQSIFNIRWYDRLSKDFDVALVAEFVELVEVVEVAEVADSYIVYTVESYQTIKSKSFNKKSHAIDQAKKWVLENSKQHVYISGYRSKDGQDFYINPDGNAELVGKSWGENDES